MTAPCCPDCLRVLLLAARFAALPVPRLSARIATRASQNPGRDP